MAIIYSYPTVLPNVSDLVLGTDVSGAGKPTKNFTVQSLVDLVAGGAAGLGAVLTISNNAQDAQGNNQSAINFENVQGTGTFTAGSFADGTMNITSGVGTAFTSFESTSFTGKLDAASFNQDNIRTLGILTDLKVGNATPAITSIVTAFTNPGDDIKLATTKAIVDYIATKPNPETLAETLANGNTTVDAASFPQGNNIVISGRGDGTAGNKLIFNSAQTSIEFKNNGFLGATITKAQNDNVVFTSSVNSGGYQFIGDEFRVNAQVGTPNELMILAAQNFGVKLYHNGTEKLDTTSTGITVSGAVSAAVGTKELPSYTFTGDVDTGMFHPAANEIGFSTSEVLRLKVSNTGIDVTGIIDATGLIEGLSFTTDTTLSKTPMTRFVKSTDPSDPVTNPATTGISAANLQVDTMVPTVLAVKNYADIVAGAKTLEYEGDTTGPFALNLTDDNFKIEGGTNIGTVATNVATNVGTLTVNLNDSVTITGTMKADTFTTTAGTATWVTTVLAGFTKITSALFVGDATASLVAPIPPNPAGTPNNVQFQGNASSANRLGPSDGTIQLSVGTGATLGVSSGAVKYTDGGDITITTSLLNTTVTGKTLQGLPTPAAATVVAGDTILQGIGKLQSQINGIANGLQFQGTWNASMDTGGTDNTPGGTPALASGGGEASSGTTDATTANELVDSTKNFTTAPNIVAVGDKVINQADGQEALVTAITNAASGRLELAADIMLTGEAYIIDKTPFITAGHYYVVDAVGATTARNATLNGIQDWQVGDWVIASVNNVWQKLNNSAVEGSGTENRLTKWAAAASTLVDSGIIDDGTTIKLENDTELGGAAGDAISSVGVHTIDEQLILKKGLALNASYGTSGQVLTSAGASSDVPTWTTPTTGTVESVTAGAGIVMTGDAVDPVVNIDYLGTDNAILSATDISTGSIATTDQIWFNDVNTGTVTNTVKYAPVSKLPFDSYDKWILRGDNYTAGTAATSQDVDSEEVMTVAGGTYITSAVGDTRKVTLNHDATTRTSNTSTASPAFGATVTMFDDLQTNGTGHVTISNLKTVTLPSPVNFTPSPNGTDTGVAGYVPAPAAGTGSTAYFLNGTGAMSIPPDLKGVETVNTTSPIEGGGSSATVTVSHKAVLADNSGNAGTYTSADVTVDGNGHITGISNGSGTFTFTGTRDFTAAAAASNLFTLTKPTTGTIVFNVMLTSTNNSDESICKAFYVARAHAVTNPPFNKLIDSGPDGSNDFAVTFVGDSTTGVECKIAATGADQSISFSVEVGYDSENTTVLTQP